MRAKDKTMRKTLLAAVVMSTSGLVGSALAADLGGMPLRSAPPPAFSWTGCYFGMHGGGAFASRDITDPVQLVQDGVLGAGTTVGTTTTHLSPSGAVIGGQLGCDYQFAPNWVVGIEGAASGSTMKGSTTVGLPASPGDQATVSSRTDFLPSVTGRLGYAFDRTLLYGKAGIAWASSKYTVAGSLQGNGFDFEGFDTRGGWTAGAGIEWAFSRNWSVNLEYDFYSFGSGTALLSDNNFGSGQVDAKQNIQVVKAGVNFHMWSGW
jgi:outer membrane immunogenic protein